MNLALDVNQSIFSSLTYVARHVSLDAVCAAEAQSFNTHETAWRVIYRTIPFLTFFPRRKYLRWLYDKSGFIAQLYFRSVPTVPSPFYVFSFFVILFCLVPCGRLSWLHVSFWAHVNIVHHIIISLRTFKTVVFGSPCLCGYCIYRLRPLALAVVMETTRCVGDAVVMGECWPIYTCTTRSRRLTSRQTGNRWCPATPVDKHCRQPAHTQLLSTSAGRIYTATCLDRVLH